MEELRKQKLTKAVMKNEPVIVENKEEMQFCVELSHLNNTSLIHEDFCSKIKTQKQVDAETNLKKSLEALEEAKSESSLIEEKGIPTKKDSKKGFFKNKK